MTYDVAIVGAGPTGLALANLLGDFGVRTLLVERNAATASEPRAVIVDDETMRCFQAMGLADTIWPLLREGRATRYFAHPHAKAPFAEVNPQGREYGWPKRLRVHQPDLERVLRDALVRYPSVEVRYETEVADIVGNTMLLVGGEPVTATHIVACDGGASPIRNLLGIATSGDSYEEPWLVLDLIDDPFDPPDTMIVCDPRRPAVAVPGPNRRRRFEFMIKHGEDKERFLESATIDQLLADYGYGPASPAKIERKTIYVFHARSARQWTKDAVILAGDAAHMMPPFMGQGLNSCIRDAWNLAWKLALTIDGTSDARLIASYETERRPHVEQMIDTSVTVAELAMTTNRVKATIRNWAFRVAQAVPAVRAHVNGQFFKPKPEFERGVFVLPEGPRGPVGRMLPQPKLPGGMLLDEAMGRGFALLGIGIAPNTDHALWRDLHVKVLELPGDLFPDMRGKVLLVRPDRLVAGSFEPDQSSVFAERFGSVLGWRRPLAEAAE